MRVIVAASTDWPYPNVIYGALDACLDAAGLRHGGVLTVVHGNAHGPERDAADGWALDRHNSGYAVARPDRWPARWADPCCKRCRDGHRRADKDGFTVCPSAGFYRNEEMVKAGADLWLVFLGRSEESRRGPLHVMRLCKDNHIEGQVFRL